MSDQTQEAERALLCAMLQSQPAAELGLGLVGPDTFANALHGEVWQAIRDQSKADAFDAPLVAARLAAAGSRAVSIVADLATIGTPPAAIRQYADIVKTAARKRELWTAGQRLMQASDDLDGDDLLATATRVASRIGEIADGTGDDSEIPGLMPMVDFASQPDDPQSWIVPDLLESGDVVMILGGEGSGKSTLSRMMCLAIAAGVHPFYPNRRIEPQRTLLVDLENAAGTIRRDVRGQSGQVVRLTQGEFDSDRAWLWHHPRGLDLRKATDAQLLERVIARVRPRFVAFGSLYKAYSQGSDGYEAAAEEVRVVLDRIRAKYGVCWFLEHHMPKGDGVSRPQSPYGSSVWMRWAAYGRVLVRVSEGVYEFKRFRGDREKRDWPPGMRHGGVLSWTAIGQDELEAERARARVQR